VFEKRGLFKSSSHEVIPVVGCSEDTWQQIGEFVGKNS
jgi:hypothetical protein